ncbi:MAG: site-specific DNA-methyltransferase [bacterium]
MATLNFKGKTFVQNHHLSVKYHQLVPKKDKSLTDKVSLNDNLILHGDNLKNLKALLPTYTGKVKCIYIDPPYNTGNERWVYNDNVNSPMMQEWLGKVVDRDDLTRHDKWLCMMTPRLKLLRELLREDGVIFVSIDDNEVHHLRMLMDEVFGEGNFITQLIWRKRAGGGSDSKYISVEHEYCILYTKSIDKTEIKRLELDDKTLRNYPYEDGYVNTRGKYCLKPLHNDGLQDSPGLHYDIECPDGTLLKGMEHQWVYSESTFKDKLKDGRIEFKKSKNGWKIYYKVYLNEEKGKLVYDEEGNIVQRKRKPFSILYEVSLNKDGNADLAAISMDKKFDYPKPVDLIKHLLKLGTDKEGIVLDSFAGSGTTAHAVLDLNKEDGGNRKFILVECEDYADRITAERVRRVIKGVPNARDEKLRNGLGGTFSYFELGDPIEMESILEGDKLPTYLELARYVFYTATGEEFDLQKVDENRNFIGESKEYEVYLFYKPDIEYLKSTALTLDRAKNLGADKGKKRLVFAPSKYLDTDYLLKYRIDYCQLPFEIYKLKE